MHERQPNAFEIAARYEKAIAIAREIRRAAPFSFDPALLHERTFLIAAASAKQKPPSKTTIALVRQLLVTEAA